MDKADKSDRIRKIDAFQYRDGLIIALLAVIPLRRRTLTALRIGDNLIKAGDLWVLDIAATDTKTRRALDYPLSAKLSARIDVYLGKFRDKIPGSAAHAGLWSSNLGCPMRGDGIYEAVRRRTLSAFGFAINLHRFRTPPRASGQAAIRRTCAEQRICCVRHLERRKGTTSWRSHGSRVMLSLGPWRDARHLAPLLSRKAFRSEMSGPDLILRFKSAFRP